MALLTLIGQDLKIKSDPQNYSMTISKWSTIIQMFLCSVAYLKDHIEYTYQNLIHTLYHMDNKEIFG